MSSSTPLTLIVATTSKNGIGLNGGLPWPMLKQDMSYFARVTKRVPLAFQRPQPATSSPTTTDSPPPLPPRNVVIMGRKTWDSIPARFRPLPDRTNIVISSQPRAHLLPPVPDDVIVAASIAAGLRTLEARAASRLSAPMGRAFVIGGARVYEDALKLDQTTSVLMTLVGREYECDAHFPVRLEGDEGWRRATHERLEAFVEEKVPEGWTAGGGESELPQLEFQLYER